MQLKKNKALLLFTNYLFEEILVNYMSKFDDLVSVQDEKDQVKDIPTNQQKTFQEQSILRGFGFF